jgi:hypothetical protein
MFRNRPLLVVIPPLRPALDHFIPRDFPVMVQVVQAKQQLLPDSVEISSGEFVLISSVCGPGRTGKTAAPAR